MNKERIFLGIVTVAIAGAIAYGFYVIGSPVGQRLERFDKMREGDMQNIAFGIDAYWERNGELPLSLEDLQSPFYHVRSIADPKTGEIYEYIVENDSSYQLCAAFETESLDDVRAPFSVQVWEHGAERTCFELEAKKAKTPEVLKGEEI
ncbi:MAG: hypothetical protein QF775_01485 [archaeon]|jgi:hypothetical protein|nr:hypothetical protein [archaeon]